MTKIWVVWRDCGKNGILPLQAFTYELVARDYLEQCRRAADDPESIFIQAHELLTPASTSEAKA